MPAVKISSSKTFGVNPNLKTVFVNSNHNEVTSVEIDSTATVLDGDCALDVMLTMLGIPSTLAARTDLRIELSDYLISRIGQPWLLDLMVACQELRQEDVVLYRSGPCEVIVIPSAPAPAASEVAIAGTAVEDSPPDEETFAAMRWASRLRVSRLLQHLLWPSGS